MATEEREVELMAGGVDLTENEFLDKVDDLSLQIDEAGDNEEHAGVTVCALTHSLAVAAFDMIQANPSSDSMSDRIKSVHDHLDALFAELQDGTYFGNPKRRDN